MLTHDEMREIARAKRPYFIDNERLQQPMKPRPNPIAVDALKKTPILVDHAVHDMYKIEPGSKVFVANVKMSLKGHITKKVTIFSREQLVIGEKMKHWLPFEFGGPPGSTATPTQLFDLGYYVFETDNAKWPHMIVPKLLFEPNDQSMELQEIQKELDKLHTFKKALTEFEEDAKTAPTIEQVQERQRAKDIEAMRKHLGFDKPKLKPEIDIDTWTNFLAAGPDEDEIWMANDESMEITASPDGFGELTRKQQTALTKKQVCPDCKHKAEFLSCDPLVSGGVITVGGMRGALVTPQEVQCGNCGSRFNATGYGGFGVHRI